MNFVRWDICPYLHAMSDMGFAHGNEPTGPSGLYGRPRTNNAECYADKCHRKGLCLKAVNIKRGLSSTQ